ncbi:unnamed protein product [Camellia sinensis]
MRERERERDEAYSIFAERSLMESSRKKLRKEKEEKKEKWRTQPNSILKTNRLRAIVCLIFLICFCSYLGGLHPGEIILWLMVMRPSLGGDNAAAPALA